MPTQAGQRYVRRFVPITMIYGFMIAVNVVATAKLAPGPILAAALAILTALPVLGMIVVLGIYLRDETDEFQRDRHIVAMMVATGVLLALTSVLGMLQYAKLVGDLQVFLAFPIWCAVWGITQWAMCWRDKRADAGA